MWNMLKSKPAALAAVPSDQVIPLCYFDDNADLRGMLLSVMLKFDDKLDPDKLKTSLEELLQRNGWRKLGARLRLNDQQILEYHVPETFNESRSAFSFTHEKHDMHIAEHPIASHLPLPTQEPSVTADPYRFHDLMRRPDGPKKLADYLNSDEPQLGVHIVSFDDATLVSISWPHTLFDAGGLKGLLDAWSLVLRGRPDEVLPTHSIESDPLAELGRNATEPCKVADRQLGQWGMMSFGSRYVLDVLWHGVETRMVCVPGVFIRKLREAAIQELKAEMSEGNEQTFLSESDILCAWWTRLAVSHLPPSGTTVTVSNTYDLRGIMAKEMLPADKVYLANACTALPVLLSVKDIAGKPLSFVASAIRRSIRELGTREQVEAMAATVRDTFPKTGHYPIFGDASMHLINCSNWTKGRIFETDFSSAIVPAIGSKFPHSEKQGTPSYTQVCGCFSLELLNGVTIMGKDLDGNFWLSGTLRKGLWAGIEQSLSKAED
ncbi:uncharacterized protein BCR38DRAFT_412555 [Pseudomassariella vexata]|uniref:Transferase family-domain-containing protein n=1 Tax=Pseudomassariella vexata TaxID=1141098 RepID=A0A1Y2DK52_9PEZI|nr:uncharacterized protein BCR38DRAFT_412555 [Pseudomassariella vexata]ORY59544.1 hypothetical protein BCR38DRAFT_412555 [Pseudomassariella vexata]